MKDRIPAITHKQVCKLLPKRPLDSHKGMFGTVIVIGGTADMIGAPLLSVHWHGTAEDALADKGVKIGMTASGAPNEHAGC